MVRAINRGDVYGKVIGLLRKNPGQWIDYTLVVKVCKVSESYARQVLKVIGKFEGPEFELHKGEVRFLGESAEEA